MGRCGQRLELEPESVYGIFNRHESRDALLWKQRLSPIPACTIKALGLEKN